MDEVPGRYGLIDENQGFPVIVDYAHRSDALCRLLDAARELRPKRIITGIHIIPVFFILLYRSYIIDLFALMFLAVWNQMPL
ncbi:hypothetical protein KSP40_PGU000212 [Platanthera guangdongensis]|uniref:Mur ligase C-terminal domain-containing protein n=1 Tax=Platanthera guangdongensis TaxID=2320717 RepID=A0ABR2LQR3_9ASPA